MKRIWILCLLGAGLSWKAYAQELSISGTVKDIESREALENVTVRLFTADSVFLEGCATDRAGRFKLEKGRAGNLYLVLSSVGYAENVIGLENITKNTRLGELFLENAGEQLGEVTVSASRVVSKVNRQIIFPSTLQREASSSALELLEKMRLPDLRVNAVQRSVASLNNGSVQLRINNVKASLEDVLAVLADNVVKVEYIDMPGARYGEGVASVVNFITRRADNGFSGGLTTSNAATTGHGNNNFFLRYNRKASEWVLNYDLSYRKYRDKYTDIAQTLFFADGSSRVLEKTGLDSPFKSQVHNLSLSYNLTNGEKSMFNAKLSNRVSHNPFCSSLQLIRESGQPDLNASTGIRDKGVSPSLDLYYEVRLPKEQVIMANVVGTYLSSDYRRDYAEYDAATSALNGQEYNYTVGGDKYSVIGELIYEKAFGNGMRWTSGANYQFAHVENNYLGSTGDVTTAMDDSNFYLFTELDGRYKKLGYNLGIGFSRQHFQEGTHEYNYYTVRPKLTLSYSFTQALSARYSFSINPVLPSLDRLSDVDQWQNAYEVIVGNPQLKPYRAYANNLSLTYRAGRFYGQVSGYYQRNPKPFMMDAVRRVDGGERPYFAYGYSNQKRFEHLQGRLYLMYELVENMLSFAAYGGVNRYLNKGNDYEHNFTHYFGGVYLDFSYRKFSLSASVNSNITNMFGVARNMTGASADVAASYRLKDNLRLGVGISNPFFRDYRESSQILISEVAPKETVQYADDLKNMVYITFSWNFSIGRKSQARRAQLSNSDSRGSGIVK